jgi:hypothetical protein
MKKGDSRKNISVAKRSRAMLTEHARRISHIKRLYERAIDKLTIAFCRMPWIMRAWELRAVNNYSWDKTVALMRDEGIDVGWRQVRRAVREVDDCMLKEILAQLTELSKIRRLDIIDFRHYYRREDNELHIRVPKTDCDILFGLVYGYIAITELEKRQHLETVSHSIRRKEHNVIFKIVDELATESSSPKRQG